MQRPSAGATPGSLARSTVILLGLASLAVAVAGIRAFRDTLGPTFLALVLVITVHPLQTRLRRCGAPGWVGVVAAMATVYAVIAGLVAALVASAARLVTLLPDYGPQFDDLLDEVAGWLEDLGVRPEQASVTVSRLDLSKVSGALQDILSGLASVGSNLVLLVTLLFFLAIDSELFVRRLDVAAESRPLLVGALRDFARNTRRYLAVSSLFGLVVAVFDVFALHWLAIPLPLLWGLLSFITNYIPNIGFLVGLIPPALLGLLEGGVARMLWVVAVYSLINMVVQSLIQPKVVGNVVRMSATLTFFSVVFWALVLGPLGALLAVPMTLLVKALLIDSDPAAQWLRPLLGDTTAETAAESSSTSTRSGTQPP
ncbi:AI-2E family transporter [Parafrankia elaeagni]|uniref:AI-2E family transporter n=1 Tax=Parafrankia elaeagni TaxID=222534 RepID=UPI00039AE50F|nr:AI-2E family transporter [Parafrankia elaeagni]